MDILSNKDIAKTASKSVKSGFFDCIAAVLIFMTVFVVLSSADGMILGMMSVYGFNAVIAFTTLVSVFVMFPLYLGVINFFWRRINSKSTSFYDVFLYFSSSAYYSRALKLALLIVWKIAIYAFFCFLPLIIITLLNSPFVFMVFGTSVPAWATGLEFIKSYLGTLGGIFLLYFSFRLYLCPFLTVIDEGMTALEAAHISRMISENSLPKFVRLCFRCFGYIILSFFVLPCVYTVPYFFTCYVIHSKSAVDYYNSRLCSDNNYLFGGV